MNLQSTLRSLLVLQAPAWERPAPKLRFVANLLINTMRHPLSGLQEPKHISPGTLPDLPKSPTNHHKVFSQVFKFSIDK